MITQEEFKNQFQLAYVKHELNHFFQRCFLFPGRNAILFATACCYASGRYSDNGKVLLSQFENLADKSKTFDDLNRLCRAYEINDSINLIPLLSNDLLRLSTICISLTRYGFCVPENRAKAIDKMAEIAYWMICDTGIISRHCTSDVKALARGIYDNKNWGTMPILADALQDAGFDNEEILNRLRDRNAKFYRGESTLDRILSYSGKD